MAVDDDGHRHHHHHLRPQRPGPAPAAPQHPRADGGQRQHRPPHHLAQLRPAQRPSLDRQDACPLRWLVHLEHPPDAGGDHDGPAALVGHGVVDALVPPELHPHRLVAGLLHHLTLAFLARERPVADEVAVVAVDAVGVVQHLVGVGRDGDRLVEGGHVAGHPGHDRQRDRSGGDHQAQGPLPPGERGLALRNLRVRTLGGGTLGGRGIRVWRDGPTAAQQAPHDAQRPGPEEHQRRHQHRRQDQRLAAGEHGAGDRQAQPHRTQAAGPVAVGERRPHGEGDEQREQPLGPQDAVDDPELRVAGGQRCGDPAGPVAAHAPGDQADHDDDARAGQDRQRLVGQVAVGPEERGDREVHRVQRRVDRRRLERAIPHPPERLGEAPPGAEQPGLNVVVERVAAVGVDRGDVQDRDHAPQQPGAADQPQTPCEHRHPPVGEAPGRPLDEAPQQPGQQRHDRRDEDEQPPQRQVELRVGVARRIDGDHQAVPQEDAVGETPGRAHRRRPERPNPPPPAQRAGDHRCDQAGADQQVEQVATKLPGAGEQQRLWRQPQGGDDQDKRHQRHQRPANRPPAPLRRRPRRPASGARGADGTGRVDGPAFPGDPGECDRHARGERVEVVE